MYKFNTAGIVIPAGYRQLGPGERVRAGDFIGYSDGYYGECVWFPVNAAYHRVGECRGTIYMRRISRKVPNV